MTPLLSFEDVSVDFINGSATIHAVKGASFQVGHGEIVAIVGESGSGKSVSALSIMQLLPQPAGQIKSGAIKFDDVDLLKQGERTMQRLRGNEMAMIFQEPMTSLNPLHTVSKQIGEVLELHQNVPAGDLKSRIIALLEDVGIDHADERLSSYPHQLSGGQRQRVMIAMALANQPRLLIADEPTTALDVAVQRQILKLLKKSQQQRNLAILFITHDLNMVRALADRVYVMKYGEVVEEGETLALFASPSHPYTQALLAAEPSGHPREVAQSSQALLQGSDVRVWFPRHAGIFRRVVDHFKAVDGITLEVREGETLGVVGESGSGKTTLGMALIRLIASTGVISFAGKRLDGLTRRQLTPVRKDIQIVFQDPFASLSPRMSAAQIIGEGLKLHHPELSRQEYDRRTSDIMREVGLDPQMKHRYPHEFSGGQRQRIAIARAVVLRPKLIVLDEPTSALDRTVQSQVIDLLRDLQAEYKLAYIFISHDLAVVRALSHRIIVMRQGKVVEAGATDELFAHANQPYVQDLIRAAFDKQRL